MSYEKLDDSEVISKPQNELEENLPYEGKKGIFWIISVINSIAQKFYGDYFSPFAARIGVAGWLMGFLTSIRNLISSLFQGIFGRFSDKFGRKLFLIISLSLSFIITTLLIFLGNKTTVIIASVFQSLAICIFTPSWNAAIGDITQMKGRGSFMGRLAAAGQVFSVSSTLLIAALFFIVERFEGRVFLGWTIFLSWEQQYMIAFAFSAFSYLVALIIIFFFKETNSVKDKPLINNEVKSNLFEPFKNSVFLRFLLVHIIFSVVMSSVWPLMPFIQINILDMKFYQIALTSASFAICMGVFQVIGGRMADKIGRKKVILIGAAILIFFPISYTPAIIFQKWWFSILANIVAGSGSGFFYTTINTYILDLSKRESMGTFAGWKEALTGTATFIGSLSGGFIIDALTNSYGLIIMGISMTIGVTILRFLAFFGYLFVKENFTKEETMTKNP
ncbi:MAG TPA: MFS transporter [candidate division Zixibacteria bacterium]|nr:MFS transporter [candidate division Zixibacteria bacterium]